MIEKTLIFLKPDAVKRKLVGKILARFEDAGFNIVTMKTMYADMERLKKHYHKEDDWLTRVGGYVVKDYEAIGLSAKEELGTDEPIELGRKVVEQLLEYVSSGMIVAAVLEGNEAVENARRIVGNTYPVEAAPGSIRGYYSSDSKDLAAIEKRAVVNLMHASGSKEEAKFEIDLWFPELNK